MELAIDSQQVPGWPYLRYIDGVLHVEDVPASALVGSYGSPLFVYSKAALVSAYVGYRGALGPHSLHYTVKANPNLTLLRIFASQGCGFHTVSIGEIERLRSIGVSRKNVCFSGVARQASEFAAALQLGVRTFSIDSFSELERLGRAASRLSTCAEVLLRVRPDIRSSEAPGVRSVGREDKYGVSLSEAVMFAAAATRVPSVTLVGFSCQIGTQILTVKPWLEALEQLVGLRHEVNARVGVEVNRMWLGGGLGIPYGDESFEPPEVLCRAVVNYVQEVGDSRIHLVLSPGRSLVGNAGVLLTRVQEIKRGQSKNFCIVDSGMCELPRPVVYGSYHCIKPVRSRSEPAELFDVVGNTSARGDWIGKARSLSVMEGDLLAVFSAGAYSSSISLEFTSRVRPPEVLVDGSGAQLIRRPSSYHSMLRDENVLRSAVEPSAHEIAG